MQNGPVAAVQASQHNCDHSLGKSQEDSFLARHLCPSCGLPRPIDKDETFFMALGAPVKFAQNLAELQKRFYEASRALHPDRFTAADAESKQRSLERMSFLNEAYRTLRSPSELRDYVLELRGLKIEANGQAARGQIPMELAESWFELQDAISENPEAAAEKVTAFKKELEEFRLASEQAIKALEVKLDTLDPSGTDYLAKLEELSKSMRALNYLKSLSRDVDRISNG
jgi:molecular chaperone HscB